MVLCQSQLKSVVAHVAEAAPCRLVKDIGARVMRHHFVSLGSHFLLHPLWADLDVEVLLEASAHRLERTDFLRVHLGVDCGIASADKEFRG